MSIFTLKNPTNKLDHYLGSRNAQVTMVEYADFQCPSCAAAAPVLNTIVKNYKYDVCLVYRHFPLSTKHPYAEEAALATEAAGLQDKFWEMHHALFYNQELISSDTIFAIADELGLDMNQFESDVEEEALLMKVHSDYEGGIISGVEGTPTLFINGLKYDGHVSYEELEMAIQELIDENQIYP